MTSKGRTLNRALFLVLFLACFMSSQLQAVALQPSVWHMLRVCAHRQTADALRLDIWEAHQIRGPTFVIIDLIQFLLNIFGLFKDPEVSM